MDVFPDKFAIQLKQQHDDQRAFGQDFEGTRGSHQRRFRGSDAWGGDGGKGGGGGSSGGGSGGGGSGGGGSGGGGGGR